MFNINCNVAVIGGGPAGLAAANSAKLNGAEDVLIIERDSSLGGILQQCIHPGFGLKIFNEELTGPEYAGRFEDETKKLNVNELLNTMVLDIDENGDILCVNSEKGMIKVSADAVILAMGCRERTRGNIKIPGTRPAGIYTAGSAQRLINRQGIMVGKKVVILGSGDIGMIMARRLTLEGAEVVLVVEIMDYIAGLTRNKVQCLEDFNIPLLLSHTVTNIVGKNRVSGVVIAKVDENKIPIKSSEEFIECDTLLLSVGLIPENELTKKAEIQISTVTNGPIVNQCMQTSNKKIFASGNVVHVNDLVDNVSKESYLAGKFAARLSLGEDLGEVYKVKLIAGNNVRYICPQYISVYKDMEDVDVYFRVINPDKHVKIKVYSGGKELINKKSIRVNPGEIESITLNKDIFKSIVDNITIEILKGE